MEIHVGDVFCSQSPSFIGRAIVYMSKWWISSDGEARYGHSGIITNSSGNTIEALWKVSSRNIHTNFTGKPVIIARPVTDLNGFYITQQAKQTAISKIMEQHYRKLYPWWRVPLNLVPPLARKLATKKYVVCSELTAQYLYLIGARHDQYPGTNPDQLSDEWRRWRNYEIVFEGIV